MRRFNEEYCHSTSKLTKSFAKFSAEMNIYMIEFISEYIFLTEIFFYSTEQLPGPTSTAGSARTSASCSLASSRESSTSAPGPTPFKVLMLGGPAVGKSSLVSQFMTSEYLHAYDTSIGKSLFHELNFLEYIIQIFQ